MATNFLPHAPGWLNAYFCLGQECIYPYDGERTNDPTNGLPLRADLHTLFDLGLIRVRILDELTWEVHPSLMGDPEYSMYDGRPLISRSVKPSVKALEQHRKDHAHKWAPAGSA